MSPAEVLNKVRGALAEGRIDFFLQPVVPLPQRQRRYCECFSREPDGANGLMSAV
jgi:cyclic-di-GMP phosphodiesterase TipF (flagellum assembly factor)